MNRNRVFARMLVALLSLALFGGMAIAQTDSSTTSSTGGFTINAGSSKTINLAFNATALGVQTATLTVKTNDAAHASTTINPRGLGTAGTGGTAFAVGGTGVSSDG